MTEIAPNYPDLLAEELEKIASPVDQVAFKYFYDLTSKEGLDVMPHYTFDQFENGIAPFNGVPIEVADDIISRTNLIPNYTHESTRQHGLMGRIPMLDALKGPFVQSIHEQRQERAVRIMGIHPSLATPFVIARSLGEGYREQYGEDIRNSIYIVVGAYPTVMKYNFMLPDGSAMPVSPVDFGRTEGHLLLTAPKTANTLTDQEAVQEWMAAARANFRVRNREILSKPGSILIVHPAGRRGKRAAHPPYHHVEYRPDGRVDYITDIDVPTYIVGVDDNLLNNPAHPGSIVNVFGDPRPYYLRTEDHVMEGLKQSARLSSYSDVTYRLEGWRDQKERLLKIGSAASHLIKDRFGRV